MKRLVATVLFGGLALELACGQSGAFRPVASLYGQLFEKESTSCFICRRTEADYQTVFTGILDELRLDAAEADSQVTPEAQRLIGLAADVLSGIADKNKGTLELPLKTIRADLGSFTKMVPQLGVVIEYADREKLGSDTTLGQALDRMSRGTSTIAIPARESAVANRITMTAFPVVAPLLVSEGFVNYTMTVEDLFVRDRALTDAGSLNQYNKWMDANKPEILAIRELFPTDPTTAGQRLSQLLDKTKSVTPVTLQPALQTGLLYQLIGSPKATVRVRLCPVCRILLGK